MPGTLCPGRVPLPLGCWLSSHLHTRGQPHFSEVTGSTLGSGHPSPHISQPPCGHPGGTRSRRRGGPRGRGGARAGARRARCRWVATCSLRPRLAQPAVLAWQSGPAAPAVILRFLGHHRAGSRQSGAAGGAGGCEQGHGAGKETRAGSMAGLVVGGVCAGSSGESLEAVGVSGVCLSSPACLPRLELLPWTVFVHFLRCPWPPAAWAPGSTVHPALASRFCDAAVPHRPAGPDDPQPRQAKKRNATVPASVPRGLRVRQPPDGAWRGPQGTWAGAAQHLGSLAPPMPPGPLHVRPRLPTSA